MDRYQNTFNIYNQIAQIYQDKFMDFDLYDDTYDTFCLLIDAVNPNIFEIACGPGNITKYILTKRPDFIIHAIDIAPNMLELAKVNNPSVHFQLMDCRNIDSVHFKYEGIICGFCLPYLSKEDCFKLIKDCADLLKTGGILYLSAIEGEESMSGYESNSKGLDAMYINYHQEAYLRACLDEYHFEVIDLIRKPYLIKEGQMSTHMIIIARQLEL